MSGCHISALEYYLPDQCVTTEDLCYLFPARNAQELEAKLGISSRYVCSSESYASDLAIAAARKLFDRGACSSADIDYLLVCTQTPDYLLPNTASLIQCGLGLQNQIGAVDLNIGCAGFVHGLGIANGLIVSNQAARVLLITADTYTKVLAPNDGATRLIFGDGAAATLLEKDDNGSASGVGPFVYGTDGTGAVNLMMKGGGMRHRNRCANNTAMQLCNNEYLTMNGREIFAFMSDAVPRSVHKVLASASLSLDDIDTFIFHQASKPMLEHLQRRLRIPNHKWYSSMSDCGNTVSSSIPIALKRASEEGILHEGHTILLAGFGVGYTWASCILRWRCVKHAGLTRETEREVLVTDYDRS